MWVKKTLFICVLFLCLFSPVLSQLHAQADPPTPESPPSGGTMTQSPQTGTGSSEIWITPTESLPSLNLSIDKLSLHWQKLTGELTEYMELQESLIPALNQLGIPLSQLPLYFQKQQELVGSMKASSENMQLSVNKLTADLQAAHEDYAAEQEYNIKREAALSFQAKLWKTGFCVGLPVAFGLGIWAGYEISKAVNK